MIHHLLHWLAVHIGADKTAGSSVFYNFWSGFGSDLGEVTIIGGLWMMWRKHNCHVKGCWRVGRHPHGPFNLCSKHHPLVSDEGPTHEEILTHAA